MAGGASGGQRRPPRRFETPASLGPADAWQAAGDEDLYWPASLH